MAKQTTTVLTVEAVRSRLERAHADLANARKDLPLAQIAVARAAFVGRDANDAAFAVRARISRLEDVAAGLEMLLPVAERDELTAEIGKLESECTARQRAIDKIDERLHVLKAEVDALPFGVRDPQGFRGQTAAKHPKVAEYETARAEQRNLEQASQYALLRIKAARERVAAIEAESPHVLGEAPAAAA